MKMPRRCLRVVCSSSSDDEGSAVPSQPPPPLSHQIPPIQLDDDEEDARTDRISHEEVGITLQTIKLSSSNPNSVNPNVGLHNPNITEPIPFNISDDELDEVMDDLVPINPDSGAHFGNNPVYDAINSILLRIGLGLKREWLESCIGDLERSIQGFLWFDDSQKAKLCFEQFLFADMNHCGAGVLPRDVHELHLVDLKGPFILQVDEIVNISSPLRSRYQKAAPGVKRCLKLSLTDGVQRIFGMEYRPIKDLEVLSPAGLKVVVSNVNVRRGILMLVPEVIEVLGGKVEELDAALQRLVNEVNKPPRGRRTGVVSKLSERATLAAWLAETVNVQERITNSRTAAMPSLVDLPGTSSGIPTSEGTEYHHRDNVGDNQSSAPDIPGVHMVAELGQSGGRMTAEENAVPITGEEVGPNIVEDMDDQEVHMVDELEHPFMLNGEKESPFTYLASLSVKWAAMKDTVSTVHGKVKCFLTGVKGFQYKKRTTYELRVFIDDGSLISEILIDHYVVQNYIGYSPDEVSKALTSSDASQVTQMKETLKQFQVFLINFEGTMLVRMTEESSLPVAIEMQQGCPASDAWLLLQRLVTSSPTPTQQNPHSSRERP